MRDGEDARYTARVGRRWQGLQGRWVAIVLVAIGFAMLASALTGQRGMVRIAALRGELAEANDQNFQLLQAINHLRTQLHRIRSDDEALERLARRRLSLVRDGETIYQLNRADGERGPAAEADATPR